MCSPKYDIWLSNVVIIKSDGTEVENSSKSHGEEDVKFENKRKNPIHRNKKENKSAGHSPVCTETEVEMGGACSQIR